MLSSKNGPPHFYYHHFVSAAIQYYHQHQHQHTTKHNRTNRTPTTMNVQNYPPHLHHCQHHHHHYHYVASPTLQYHRRHQYPRNLNTSTTVTDNNEYEDLSTTPPWTQSPPSSSLSTVSHVFIANTPNQSLVSTVSTSTNINLIRNCFLYHWY